MISLICNAIEDQNDREYMLWLYEEFGRLMFATAAKYAASRTDIEDIVQDGVVSLIKKVDTLRGKERCVLASYVVSTIRNTAINHLRKQSIVNGYSTNLDESSFELESQAPPLDDLMMLFDSRNKLSAIWDKLPEEAQFLLSGKYIYGYTDQEMAKYLKCKPASIRMKLTRARRAAFQLLSENEKGEDDDET